MLIINFMPIVYLMVLKRSLWIRCKKFLNHRFGRAKFSSYDFGAEFCIYMKRNTPFVYKTVLLV